MTRDDLKCKLRSLLMKDQISQEKVSGVAKVWLNTDANALSIPERFDTWNLVMWELVKELGLERNLPPLD